VPPPPLCRHRRPSLTCAEQRHRSTAAAATRPSHLAQQQHTQGGDTPTELLEGISHEGLKRVLQAVQHRDPDQPEFLSAVKEVAQSLQPVFERQPELLRAFEVMCEPERQIIFRVPWCA
jgi:hypothetical protein